MAVDALDPGPDGDYPFFPRDAQGLPVWSDTPTENAEGGTMMPRGIQQMRHPTDPRRLTVVDITPRIPNGTPIDPPAIPPEDPHAA